MPSTWPFKLITGRPASSEPTGVSTPDDVTDQAFFKSGDAINDVSVRQARSSRLKLGGLLHREQSKS